MCKFKGKRETEVGEWKAMEKSSRCRQKQVNWGLWVNRMGREQVIGVSQWRWKGMASAMITRPHTLCLGGGHLGCKNKSTNLCSAMSTTSAPLNQQPLNNSAIEVEDSDMSLRVSQIWLCSWQSALGKFLAHSYLVPTPHKSPAVRTGPLSCTTVSF